MKKIVLASVFVITAMVFTNVIHAQNFPATQKEVKDILCATKWKADSVILDGKASAAADIIGEVYLELTPGGKYTLTTDTKKTDVWKIDMIKKCVEFYEKGERMTNIRKMSRTRIEISEVPEDHGKGEEMTVILKPVK